MQATEQIRVRLQLFADLRKYLPAGESGAYTISLPEGATVATMLSAAGIPEAEEITIGLNGERGTREQPLKDGDDVVLFSPMEGG